MRCLYCGKRLAFLRKLTGGEFCTEQHRHLYQQEQEQMALARLMDAQKRFSSFTDHGPVNGAAVNGASTNGALINGALTNGTSKASGPAMKTEMSHKFINPVPDPLLAGPSQRPIVPSPLGQLPELFVPELTPGRECAPSMAASVGINAAPREFATAAMRAAGIEIEPVVSTPQLPHLAAPRLSFALSELQPAVPLELITGVLRGESRVRPEAEIAPEPFYAVASQAFAMKRGFSAALPMGWLENTSCEARVSGVHRLPTPVEPCVVSGEVATMMLRSALRPLEASTAVPAVETVAETLAQREAMVDDSDAPGPLQSQLFPLDEPAPRPSELLMRRARFRELFFPVFKAGYLQTLAAKAAKRVCGPGALAGTESGPWKPGRVPFGFEARYLDSMGQGVASFPHLPPDCTRMVSVPDFDPVAVPLPSLCAAGQTDYHVLVSALDVLSTFGSRIPRDSAECVPVTDQPVAPAHPIIHTEQPGLAWQFTFEPLSEPIPFGGSQRLRAMASEAFVPDHTQYVAMPAFACEPLRTLAFELPFHQQMAAIEPLGGRASVRAIIPVEPGFEDYARKIEASLPGSSVHGGCAPAKATAVFPLLAGEGAPYPKNTVAVQELTTLWPEPLALTPKMPPGIVEDSQVRSAVQAMNVILEQERKLGFLSRIHMPALPVSRADLKWFVMSIPAVLLLAVYSLTNHSSNPEVAASRLPAAVEVPVTSEPDTRTTVAEPPAPRTAPAPVVPKAPVVNTSAPAGFFDNFRQSIMQRAAISLSDDFRSGLGDWEGRGDWSKAWSYDAAGFVHTGPLALYKPSVPLSDYRMEFLGQIEKKSMGWVYRASDFENYYATKIILTKNGPMPGATIERYAVINGKVSSLARRPMPIQVRADMLYRVRMDVRGDGFTLTVQGQVVDHWSDNRLKTGGVGFFSTKGEQSSLRWVEVSHQYDFLGRLCAFLAPYNLPTKDGSAKQ